MRMPITRRRALRGAALGMPALLAACATGDAQPPLQPEPGYAHLTPLRLNVLEIEVVEPSPGPAFRVDPPAPLSPVTQALRMGRERLSAVGTQGRGRYVLDAASLTRETADGGGLFSERTERLTVLLRARVEILGADGGRIGFSEAEVRRTATSVADSPAARARAADLIVRQAMDDLNVEFEFQLRRNLRDWIMTGEPSAPLPGPVLQETLPTG
ncbi:hypothetical protein [Teichococcus aerofrigidensis]|nr:hypothetical protein [Roseomonas sp. KE0001]